MNHTRYGCYSSCGDSDSVCDPSLASGKCKLSISTSASLGCESGTVKCSSSRSLSTSVEGETIEERDELRFDALAVDDGETRVADGEDDDNDEIELAKDVCPFAVVC